LPQLTQKYLVADGLDFSLGDDAQGLESGQVFVDVLHIENMIKWKMAFYFNTGNRRGKW
jgi:hypothetical protein